MTLLLAFKQVCVFIIYMYMYYIIRYMYWKLTPVVLPFINYNALHHFFKYTASTKGGNVIPIN